MTIRIGTRGSKLALWQAEAVWNLLNKAGFDASIQIFSTKGDEIQDRPVKEIGGKGLFTKELDQALLNGKVDIAVHSAKDIPAQLEAELELIACLKREDPRDALVTLAEQVDPENQNVAFKIGTSSERRKSMLRHYLPNWKVMDLRGNIDSRIQKLKDGHFDGILLALSGLKRLGVTGVKIKNLNPTAFTPPPGQGTIAIASTSNFAHKEKVRQTLNHATTEVEMICERAFLSKLNGGCSVPLFGMATVLGEYLSFNAGIYKNDSMSCYREEVEGLAAHSEKIGFETAQTIIEKSGGIRGEN